MERIVHIYLRGNHREDIFFDKVDFINAWNRLWMSAYATDIQILAVELLHNHLHIVVRIVDFTPERVSEFIHYFRMSISYYFNHRHEVTGSLGGRRYGKGIVTDTLEDGGEDARDAICYTLRNVLHHGVTPAFQKWKFSTCLDVFGLREEEPFYTIANLPDNIQHAYFPANRQPPKNWKVTMEGLIIPPDTVFPRSYVEKLFGSKEKYVSKLKCMTRRELNSASNEFETDIKHINILAVSDQDILDFVEDSTQTDIVKMDRVQKKDAIIQSALHFPKASIRQFSRIFGIPFSTINFWLHTHRRPVRVQSFHDSVDAGDED